MKFGKIWDFEKVMNEYYKLLNVKIWYLSSLSLWTGSWWAPPGSSRGCWRGCSPCLCSNNTDTCSKYFMSHGVHLQFVTIITTLEWFSCTYHYENSTELQPNSLVKTGAETAETAADAGAEEEKDDDSEDDPDPDDGAALAVNREAAQAGGGGEPGLLVAVGHVLQALAVHHTGRAVELLHEALDLLVGISKGVLDVILSVSSVPWGCNLTHIRFILII